MAQKLNNQDLPKVAFEFIDTLVKKVRYRKKVRDEVRHELIDHFLQALNGCRTVDEKEQAARYNIESFGDIDLLADLIRRGKKRCRPLWKKTIVIIAKAVGVLLLLAILRVGYLSVGTTVISVDYVKWLNDYVRQGRDQELNANPYYKKAVELGKV